MQEEVARKSSGTSKCTIRTDHRPRGIKCILKSCYDIHWFRVACISSILLASLCNHTFSWLVIRDLCMQLPGLVFGAISGPIFISLVAFTIVELLFVGAETGIWIKVLWNEPHAWIFADLVSVTSLLVSQIPIGIFYTYLSACDESTVSTWIKVKGLCTLCFILLRATIFVFAYLNYVPAEASTQQETVATLEETERDAEGAIPVSSNASENPTKIPRFWNTVNFERLHRLWIIVCPFLIFCFLCLLVLNILIFQFNFIRVYHDYSEWSKNLPKELESLEHVMIRRYFFGVEIFLQEKSLPNERWLHLTSLLDLMRQRYQGIVEHITINYIESKMVFYCIFARMLSHPNGTTEALMNCWIIKGFDDYIETYCEELGKGNITRLNKLEISLTYEPPSNRRRLGVVFYNASKTDKDGKRSTNVPLTLGYFRNAYIYRSMDPVNGTRLREADSWETIPFRPANKTVSGREKHRKYSVESGDLIPITTIWKTGKAKCSSTAPTGPLPIST
ncbi:unnamed protein product [Calicophoron daubneyi]|uniref:Anoctamin n=1 Tax=Calicophoron daubneyi TaxID=300641 RepID=A0AAV2T7E1_CALDB